jgi:hypothetical protein
VPERFVSLSRNASAVSDAPDYRGRMRTKPLGSRVNRKRRRNSSRDKVIHLCGLLSAESRQRNEPMIGDGDAMGVVA